MKNAGKKAVYKIDIARFLKRKGLTQQELAKRIDCSLGLVGGWASHRGVPSYEKCILLLKEGMTVAELFGEDTVNETLKAEADDFETKVGEAIVSWITKKVTQLGIK